MNPDTHHALIEASGDPSVGIPSSSFSAEIFVPSNEPELLEEVREKLQELYAMVCDEKVGVAFDFELKAREAGHGGEEL